MFDSWAKAGLQEGKPNCVSTYLAFAGGMNVCLISRLEEAAWPRLKSSSRGGWGSGGNERGMGDDLIYHAGKSHGDRGST